MLGYGKKIDERTFEFALEIIALYKFLVTNKEYVLSKQVLRSGTSIGANVQESQAAQSRADFISKMSIVHPVKCHESALYLTGQEISKRNKILASSSL